MPSKVGILSRLFGRTQNPVIGKLWAHGVNTPLAVHPAIGERLLGAYMDGGVDSAPTVASSAGSIALINISGAMVNRPMPDMCGPGPISYSDIRGAIASALSDENVSAIVLRMDTPGGMCAGCFDLSDWIYAQRGKKPIVAQVDDMAYSAGYAIASACDSIQITRTGGAGSIGVVCYHVDQSQADAKAGIKVTYIYSGDHKVDGNWHEPLPGTVKNVMQVEVDDLRQMFAASVATYRGVQPQAILDTQADCYTGQAAIDAGLADTMGTLEDLIARLAAPATPVPTLESSDMSEETEPTAEQKAAARRATLDKAIADAQTLHENRIKAMRDEHEAGAVAPDAAAEARAARASAALALNTALSASTLPAAVQAAMIGLEIPEADIPARLESASKIVDLCHAAKLDTEAAAFITSNCSVEKVRADLAAAVADAGPEIVTLIVPGAAKPAANLLDPAAIYAAHNNPRGKTK